MAIIRCKMCGGDVELAADKTFGTCECCGSSMTFPKVSDDQRAAAFNRGNHFRRIGEFDKALAVYERIVREDDTDAEAHWCCALCRFGIEYVEDPATFEWLPTCHRASFDSFLEDVDYLAALEHSDGITRRQYQKDAAKIAEIQRGILATSQNEEPFDVFICYKESDENGDRTRDSLLAQEIYYQLTEQGRRVFFSRITLEDMVGKQYEPYIFAALNSAKVMIVVGTKPEHLNAVWVKNEWSRFLAMMKKDRSKLLLPCYRDMDPYDMPEQLSVLQSYDMAKLGFIQDLTRGIAKVLDAGKPAEAAPVQQTVVVQQAASTTNSAALLKRGNMALEDGEWMKANEFFEEVLNQDPECAEAYLGKALAQHKKPTLDALVAARLAMASAASIEECTIPVNSSHISEMVEKYRLDGYLSADTITKGYQFSEIYHSQVTSAEAMLVVAQQFWSADKLLTRAFRYASGEIAAKLNSAKDQVISQLEQQLEAAKREADENRRNLQERYADFLTQADARIAQLYADASQKRHVAYLQQISFLENCDSAEKLQQLAKDLDAWNGYEDSEAMAAKCREKASKLQNELKALAQKCMALNDAITKLESERSGLGIFAGKRKKEIEAEIESLQAQLNQLRAQQKQSGIPTLTESTHPFVSAGDHVYFGKYPHKSYSEKSPVEWTVLERKGNQLVLISTLALDCVPYYNDKSRVDISWEKCYLRSWLHTTFMNDCFQSDEQKHLVTQHGDQVTILSAAEVKAYWPEVQKEKRCAMPTDRAYYNGALKFGAYVNGTFVLKADYNGPNGNTIYTLRHPNTRPTVDVCNDSGMIVTGKVNIWAKDCAVRPVICVDFTK